MKKSNYPPLKGVVAHDNQGVAFVPQLMVYFQVVGVDKGLQEGGVIFLCFSALCMYVKRGGNGLIDEHFLGEDYNVVVVLSSFSVVCSPG